MKIYPGRTRLVFARMLVLTILWTVSACTGYGDDLILIEVTSTSNDRQNDESLQAARLTIAE